VWNDWYWKYSYIPFTGRAAAGGQRIQFAEARSVQGRSIQDRFAGTVIKSNIAEHSAVGLCADESMVGPDLVSLQENMFCDMLKRAIYPVCSGDDDSACFDLDANTLKGGGNGDVSISSESGTDAPAKEYSDVHD
jgi:hypothetical protein